MRVWVCLYGDEEHVRKQEKGASKKVMRKKVCVILKQQQLPTPSGRCQWKWEKREREKEKEICVISFF